MFDCKKRRSFCLNFRKQSVNLYPQYTSAYLFMVPGEVNDNEDLFWPWADQFFKLFVRDQE